AERGPARARSYPSTPPRAPPEPPIPDTRLTAARRSVTPLAHHPTHPRSPDPRPREAAGRPSGTRGSAPSGLLRASARCAAHLIILARPSRGRGSVAVRERTVHGGVPRLDGH